jgi:hypothetical protein
MAETLSVPPEYNFYSSIYRNDISRWAGQTYKRPENITREIDLTQSAASSQAVTRCIRSLNGGCRGVSTGTTLYQDSYVPHMAATRDLRASYTARCPPSPAVPDSPDPSILRPTTEYGSRYRVPRPEPLLSPEFIARCSTTNLTARSVPGGVSPAWNTTYRQRQCEKVTEPQTSRAVTFFTHTGLR